MTERSVIHSTFIIERTYDVPPARVFAAFTDPAAHGRWFGTTLITSETLYQEIVPDQRIIYAYTMAIDDVRISASLAVIELEPAGVGTQFVYTEHAAFLDGRDTPAVREAGCRTLFDRLEVELRNV
jgi:uncharacterized protein YndB with AHSA1/START domain